MKKLSPESIFFFVDESGDPTFFDKRGNLIVNQPGCSPILILGMVEISDPGQIRQSIKELQIEIGSNPYFNGFLSIKKTIKAFHAKDDIPEVRYEFFKLISKMNIHASFIVARKIERVFRNSFHCRENDFYDHMITKLFSGKLHTHENNYIFFAKRGSRDRQTPLENAIKKSISEFESRWKTKVDSHIFIQAQSPVGEPCLSVIDYLNWAVYRAFVRGEMRYFESVRDKISLLVDLYDTKKYPENWYNKKNPFDAKKITPL
jgi:hypothetical protein